MIYNERRSNDDFNISGLHCEIVRLLQMNCLQIYLEDKEIQVHNWL